MSMLQLGEVPHIMSDGYICDERRSLIFLSIWGRDTAVQELLARLTLKNEDALTQLTLIDTSLNEHIIFPGNTDNIDKRASRHSQTRFGTLVHSWLFDKRCLTPDRANGNAFLLLRRDDPQWRERVWSLLNETTTLPLLEHWRDRVLTLLQTSQMLTPVGGYGDLSGWQLSLDIPRLTGLISEAIIMRELSTTPRPDDFYFRSLHAA
ncbi:hypothetical protein [Salmonella enterica]|uniref:hypothetical protein n=1 Tax=Salmonella enterica TaxID=28901 RepID=UPI0003BCCB40|nr:hypothetical protein [Salmonella enterica]APV90416.1 hypothetical protein SEEM1958_022035 [Salmonella enterica subsp. enterica serovar Mbandaka str. ATCC 51958]EBF8299850.1 hypothetical protein [Salmonella enterica subsp. enterica serovar Mbandaka]